MTNIDKTLPRYKLALIILVSIALTLTLANYIVWNIFYVSFNLGTLLSTLIVLGSYVLLLLYFVKGYENNRWHIFPFICLCVETLQIYDSLIVSASKVSYSKYAIFIIDTIVYLALLTLLCITVFSALTGHLNKTLRNLSLAFYTARCAYSLIGMFAYPIAFGDNYIWVNYFSMYSNFLSTIFIFLSLLLFTIFNRQPVLVHVFIEKERQLQALEENKKKLQLLKEKYELGIIDEEEYHIQTQELLSKI